MNFDVGRQDLSVQFLGLSFDRFQDVLCLLPAQHQNDAFDRIVIFFVAEFAEARSVPDGYVSDITNADRHAFVGAHNDVSNVVGVLYEPNAAHVIELSTLGIKSAAGVGVVGGERRHHLRNGQVVSVDAGWVEQHLILHYRATEAGVVGYAVHGTIGALDYPILEGFKLLRRAVGTFEDVAIHQAAGAKQWR